MNWYADARTGDYISQSDILNDVFEYASMEKHDEFIEWAGDVLGVMFTFDDDEAQYLIERRVQAD